MRRIGLAVAGCLLLTTGFCAAGDRPTYAPIPVMPYSEHGAYSAPSDIPPMPPEIRTHPKPRHLLYYYHHTPMHGAIGFHHGQAWRYVDGEHHGYLNGWGHGPYLPRADGASYTFGRWVPRRSFYHAYQPGNPDLPYGFSPEPYYTPAP